MYILLCNYEWNCSDVIGVFDEMKMTEKAANTFVTENSGYYLSIVSIEKNKVGSKTVEIIVFTV
jgi:hypothetical protein